MTLTPHLQRDGVTLYAGDCLDVLRADENGYAFELGYGTRRLIPDASVDAVCTDPPYGLGFMGKEWDSGKSFVERKAATGNTFDHVGGNHNPSNSADAARTRRAESAKFGAWCELWAAECLRVLKPGGHLLAFGGSRTWHRLAAAVEDAGFEIRDSIAWLYGSGFPKSLDVSKAIDKAAGAEREVVGYEPSRFTVPKSGMMTRAGRAREGYRPAEGPPSVMERNADENGYRRPPITAPATPAAEQWQGWGTALKPAFEPIVVGRKPLAGTVAANVLTHGTGALNIDGCRIGTDDDTGRVRTRGQAMPGDERTDSGMGAMYSPGHRFVSESHTAGRWPANVVLDESQAATLDEQSGTLTSGANPTRRGADGDRTVLGSFGGQSDANPQRGVDKGGASRFFPVVDFEPDELDLLARFLYVAKADASERPRVDGIAHPTVKPLALMRWAVRLVTPPGGKVLDLFAGSGTTVEACIVEGFECVAIEREADYLPLIETRVARRRDVVRAIKLAGTDEGLFAFDDDEEAG